MGEAKIGCDRMSNSEGAGAAGWNETVVPVGKGPEAIDLSPDGKEVWTAHSRDGDVSIIDIASKKVTQTLNVQTKRSNRLKFTPDGKLVLISDLEAGELLVLDAQTHKEIKRMKLGANVEGILVEPDGLRAYVDGTGANNIAVIDLHTLEVSSHIPTGNRPDRMALSVH